MADAEYSDYTPALDVVRKQITEVFNRILSEVKARRDVLLAKVDEMKRMFEAKNASISETIRELEEMRAHTLKMSVKQNLAMKKQQDSLDDIDSEIEKLSISLSNDSKMKFNCSIDQLIEQVKQFGDVIDESSIISTYQSKLTAARIITGFKYCKISVSTRFHFDYKQQLLYLLNNLPETRQPHVVLNANDFTFVRTITGAGDSRCIAIGNEFIYVGSSKELMLCKKSNYSILKRCQLYDANLDQICFTSENQVIGLCTSKGTFIFRVYDRTLNYKDTVELSFQFPYYLSSTLTIVRLENFYFLSDGQLFVYDKRGKNIHSLAFNKKGMITVEFVQFFVCILLVISLLNRETNRIKETNFVLY